MSIAAKPNNPKLRFKQQDEEKFPHWANKKLGAFAAKHIRGISLSSITDREGPYPVYGAGEIDFYTKSYQSDVPYIAVIKDGSGVGRVMKCAPYSSISGTLEALVPTHGNDVNFLYYFLQQFDFTIYKTGAGIPHVYYRDYSKAPVSFPKKEEQEKIASFLSAVERKISLLRDQASALLDYKTGMMQKLFSQQIRFTEQDGQLFPTWKATTFGQVFGWIRTNSLSREKLTHNPSTGIQNIHYGDIHTKFPAIFRQDEQSVPFVSENASIKAFSSSDFLQVGDIVIADASEDYSDIGKTIEIMDVRPESMVAGLHTFIARPRKGVLAAGFAGYLLRSEPMRRQIQKIAQGISVLGVSKSNLEQLTFWLPNIEEQEKIASFLMGLDRKIEAVEAQVSEMETFKQGLLQQMFP